MSSSRYEDQNIKFASFNVNSSQDKKFHIDVLQGPYKGGGNRIDTGNRVTISILLGALTLIPFTTLVPVIASTQCYYSSGWISAGGLQDNVHAQSDANVYICDNTYQGAKFILQSFHDGSRWACCGNSERGSLQIQANVRDINFNIVWQIGWQFYSSDGATINGPTFSLGQADYACTQTQAVFANWWGSQWTDKTNWNCLGV